MNQPEWLLHFYGGPSDGAAIRANYCPPKFQSDNDTYLLVHQCEIHKESWYVVASADLGLITEGVLFDDGPSTHASTPETGGSSGATSDDGRAEGDGAGE